MFKTVLFDVDGTLIDTESAIIKSFQKILQDFFQQSLPPEKLTYILGIPGRNALLPFTKDEQQIAKILTIWDQEMKRYADESHIFADVESMLTTLHQKHISLGVITSKTDSEMQAEFARYDLEHYFDVVVTASDTSKHKPTDAPILFACQQLRIEPADTLYVGDAVYDLRSAHAAQAKFGLAQWGAHDNPEFKQADYHFEKPQDLLDLVD